MLESHDYYNIARNVMKVFINDKEINSPKCICLNSLLHKYTH